MERWTSVVIKHHGKKFEQDVYDKYEVSCKCRIRNKKTGKYSSTNSEQVGLRGNGIRKMLKRHRICLASFYPDDIPINIDDYDVDHIDGNHENNILSNLQWLTKSEHTRKTIKQTKNSRKKLIDKRGKPVIIIDDKTYNKIGPTMIGREFKSCSCVQKVLNIHQASVSSSSLRGCWAGNYKFQFLDQQILPGEIFKQYGDYLVSNKGRYKNKNGKISNGSRSTSFRYRCANITINGITRQVYMHVLVWKAFNGPIPRGMVVMHNDTYNTLDKEGYERNWLVDLSIGTRSENTKSYHANRKDSKRVRCLDDDLEFMSAADASKYYGINIGTIWKGCNKYQKTCHGKKFEYI